MQSEPKNKVFPSKSRRHPISSFTLIELLVVIGIISILIAILMPALSNARTAAKKQLTTTNINGLKVALNGYYNEYGTWPTDISGNVPTDNLTAAQLDGLYHILIGENRYLDSTTAGCNSRRVAFSNFKATDLKAVNTSLVNNVYSYLITGTATNYVDPWNNSYMVRFDDNADNLTETYSASSGNHTISGGFAIWSAGPDGKVDNSTTAASAGLETDPVNPTQSINTDNLTSWK